MSSESERIERVGYVLWGFVLATVVFGGLAVATGAIHTTNGGHDSAAPRAYDTPSSGMDRAEAQAESHPRTSRVFEFDPGVPAFDFAIDLPGVAVSGENVGNPSDPQSVGVESDAIDDGVARDADAGLSAVGLNEPNPSGVAVDVDGNGSASAAIDPDPGDATAGSSESARSVVDRCADSE